MSPDIWTYQDAIGHAIDYMGAASDAETERYARRAVQLAYKELANKRNWNYYHQIGHINTVAPYQTGTIAFDYTGGAYERMVTLTSGTWPTWAADGMLGISNVFYPVTRRISDTVITLSESNSPSADIAAGTEYFIAKEQYTLPVDFGAMDELIQQGYATALSYTTPGEFLSQQRTQVTTANPWTYTITNDPNRHGVMVLRFYPAPDAIYPFAFYYRRRPRPLQIDLYSAGTVSLTSGSTTASGADTAWNSRMGGAIIRFAQDSTITDEPTGLSGASPYWLERSVSSVTNATALVLDQDPLQNLSSVRYSISDPVDIESGAMLTYFLREIEKQCRAVRRIKPMEDEEGQYRLALNRAMEADNRHFERETGMVPRRLSDMPITADVE